MPSFIHSMDTELWLLSVQRVTILAGMAEPYAIRINITPWHWYEVSTSLLLTGFMYVRERNSGLYTPNAFKAITTRIYFIQAAKNITAGSWVEEADRRRSWRKESALHFKHTQNTRKKWGRGKFKAMLETEEVQQRYRRIKDDEKNGENSWHRENEISLRTG